LLANAAAVDQRDHEGLTPLLRLWVRYFVILGNDVIENVRHAADLTGELGEAWTKTEVLLHCAHFGSLEYFNSQHTQSRTLQRPDSGAFLVHAASAVDCPRAVVKIATIFYPEQLNQKDELGRTPLMLAAQAPVYKVRDLSDDGYEEDMIYDEIENGVETNENDAGETSSTQPSVIEILIEANQVDASSTACIPDNLGRLPLHATLLAGKKWNEGVKQIVQVFPEALAITEPILSGAATSQLYPFMMAAHGDGADVDTTYELLRHSPQLMNEILEKKKEIAAQNSRLLMEVVEKGLKAM
jgi:ankyrin repeat protein